MKRIVLILLVIMLPGVIVWSGGQQTEVTIKQPDGFPKRALTWIVPYGPGGGSDTFARELLKHAEKELGVPVKVVNIPGGGGLAALPELLVAPADGYTLYGAGPYIVIGDLLGNIDFSYKDVTFLARGQKVVSMLFARSDDERFSTWEDVETYYLNTKTKLTVAFTGFGDLEEYVMHMFDNQTEVDFTLVPYGNPGERYTNFVGGQTDLMYEEPGDVKNLLDAGEIKPVIVLRDTEERLADFLDIPSSAEYGIDIPYARWRGIAVRTGVAQDRIDYLEKVFEKAWNEPEFQEFLEKKYLTYERGWAGHSEMEEYKENSYNTFKQVLTDLGVKIE